MLSGTTVLMFIIINVSSAANQPFSMISEISCDTEDWSNAENSALYHRNKILNTIK